MYEITINLLIGVLYSSAIIIIGIMMSIAAFADDLDCFKIIGPILIVLGIIAMLCTTNVLIITT